MGWSKQMEQVRSAAAATMEQLVPTAQQVTPDYLVYQAAPLHNTFLNLLDEGLPRHARRCHSIAGCRPARVPKVSMDSKPARQEAPADLCGAPTEGSLPLQSHEVANCKRATTATPTGSPGTFAQTDAETKLEADPPFTTVALRNLPQAFKQADLLEAMDKCGLHEAYNFCYVPASFQDGSCRGYAFINFTTPASAAWFLSSWQGSRMFCDGYHHKPLIVAVAGVQGLEALLAQASMKKMQRVKNPAFLPYIAHRMNQ
mmetsp:Transcript_42907/g.77961  ORF Transcript_42907/g.77961 Transcript_42907/m.77961 type:complete len:258 (-) Transcript_42907:13-786(-)